MNEDHRPTAELLIDVMGEVAAMKLMVERGGTRIDIPTKVEGSQLAKLVGYRSASYLAKEVGHGRFQVPMGTARGIAARRERAMNLLRAGTSIRQTALETEFHERTVERWSAQLRDNRQPQLPF